MGTKFVKPWIQKMLWLVGKCLSICFCFKRWVQHLLDQVDPQSHDWLEKINNFFKKKIEEWKWGDIDDFLSIFVP